MHALQDQMLIDWDALGPVLRWSAPGQENHTVRPDLRNSINDLLCQELPTLAGVRIRFTATHGEACI
jgi:hypothetical protein